MTLPGSMDLQWQREVIEKWLNTPSIPLDTRPGLLEMLGEVKEEMGKQKQRAAIFKSAQADRRANEPDRRLAVS